MVGFGVTRGVVPVASGDGVGVVPFPKVFWNQLTTDAVKVMGISKPTPAPTPMPVPGGGTGAPDDCPEASFGGIVVFAFGEAAPWAMP